MPESILAKLEKGVVLQDGGYLLALESRGYVQAGPFTPEVTIEHPNALLALHQEFLHAGAKVLQVLTFYATENKLEQIGYGGRLKEINQAAVRIAREAAGSDSLVAGNICLTWKYEDGNAGAEDEYRRLFDDQLSYQTEVGVDFIIGETFLHVGEALLALECIKKTGLPSMITLSFEAPQTRDGKSPCEAAKILEDEGGGHCRREVLAGPDLHAACGRGDVRRHRRICCSPTRGISLYARGSLLHGTEGLPGQA